MACADDFTTSSKDLVPVWSPGLSSAHQTAVQSIEEHWVLKGSFQRVLLCINDHLSLNPKISSSTLQKENVMAMPVNQRIWSQVGCLFSPDIVSEFWEPRCSLFLLMFTATLSSLCSLFCYASCLFSLLNYRWGELKVWVDKSEWVHRVSMVPCLPVPGGQTVLEGQEGEPGWFV